jgi:hypothetical protein
MSAKITLDFHVNGKHALAENDEAKPFIGQSVDVCTCGLWVVALKSDPRGIISLPEENIDSTVTN